MQHFQDLRSWTIFGGAPRPQKSSKHWVFRGQCVSPDFIKWINWGLRLVGILGLVVGLVGCQPVAPSGEWVRVSQVKSGQTFEVLSVNNPSPVAQEVRLIGVESPAWAQEPWFTQATENLENWIGSDRLLLLESDVEKQFSNAEGRVIALAYAWKGDHLLNEELIASGAVLAKMRSPNLKYQQRFAQAQEKARLLGLGLWNPETPMRQTPAEFRQSNQE